MAKVLKKQKKIIKKPAKKNTSTQKLKKVIKLAKPFKKVSKKTLVKKKLVKTLKLERYIYNPIIKPRPYSWESKATLNPAAFIENDKIHLIYRAIGDDDSSVLGYASTLDGYRLKERPTHSVYHKFGKFVKSNEPINYVSGGGWNGGCEDPRVTLIEDTVYMLYTAFDGWGSVRIALTSIKLDDFKKKIWDWKKPTLISPPGEIHKNWVLFPEKINGKFAILHSISPKVLIDYVQDFDEFDGTKFIKSYHSSNPSWNNSWDNKVRGVGPTPIKTNIGWLVLYHAMDKNDPNRYKLGAMILDFKDTTRILYRSKSPILEPDKYYENEGFKAGVVYSCGAVVKDEKLFVYYGGADSVVCVATVELKDLIDDLLKNRTPRLKKDYIFESE